jgi:release factor glutamine methyltransferase
MDRVMQSQRMSAPAARSTPSGDEWTVKRILDWTTDHLKKHGSESARLDAEILLAHARGCKRIELYTRYEERLTDAQRSAMRELVKRRANAEPVAYLVGFKEFYSLPFAVTADVLIPRPETETLVLEAVELAKGSPAEQLRLLDLCTGSGCVAVAAAKGSAKFAVTATDLSDAALEVARGNAERNGVLEKVEFRQGDLFDALPAGTTFDVILSNPPYVAEGEYESLPPDIRLHEPATALLAGADGMDALRRIAAEAPRRLNAGGHLLVELDPKQAEPVAELLRPSFHEVRFVKDLAGKVRVVHAAGRGERIEDRG